MGPRRPQAVDVCPGFVGDCLETLEEIAHRGARGFQAAGGSELCATCLPERPPGRLAALASQVQGICRGWPAGR